MMDKNRSMLLPLTAVHSARFELGSTTSLRYNLGWPVTSFCFLGDSSITSHSKKRVRTPPTWPPHKCLVGFPDPKELELFHTSVLAFLRPQTGVQCCTCHGELDRALHLNDLTRCQAGLRQTFLLHTLLVHQLFSSYCQTGQAPGLYLACLTPWAFGKAVIPSVSLAPAFCCPYLLRPQPPSPLKNKEWERKTKFFYINILSLGEYKWLFKNEIC